MPSDVKKPWVLVLGFLTLLSPVALAQDGGPPRAPAGEVRAATAAELLAALRAAGVELPADVTVGEDGTVVVPAAVVDSPARMKPAGAGPATGQAAARATGPAATPTSAGAREVPDAPEEEAIEEEERLWEQRLEAAFSLDSGNTESSDLRAAYRATRESDIDKLRFEAAYFYGTEDSDTTEHSFDADVLYDRDIKDTRWLWFVNGRYDWDQFEDWDHRVGLTAGLGYRAIDREDLELILRAGIGFSREFGSDNDDFIPEGLLGYDFRWDLSDRQGLESTFRYFPDFDDFGEFRTLTTLGWRFALDVEDGLDLTAGLRHEFESDVDSGTDENDLNIYAGLGLDF